MTLARYQPLIELLLLVSVVVLVLFLVIRPAIKPQPIQSSNMEVIPIAFTEASVYLQWKREIGDWCKILLPIAGFLLGRIRRNGK